MVEGVFCCPVVNNAYGWKKLRKKPMRLLFLIASVGLWNELCLQSKKTKLNSGVRVGHLGFATATWPSPCGSLCTTFGNSSGCYSGNFASGSRHCFFFKKGEKWLFITIALCCILSLFSPTVHFMMTAKRILGYMASISKVLCVTPV